MAAQWYEDFKKPAIDLVGRIKRDTFTTAVFALIFVESSNTNYGTCRLTDNEIMQRIGITQKQTLINSLKSLIHSRLIGVEVANNDARKIIGFYPERLEIENELKFSMKGIR